MREHLSADSVDDATIRRRIGEDFMHYGREWCPHTATAAEVYARLSAAERRDHPWVLVATAHPAKFNEVVEPLIGKAVDDPPGLARLLDLPRHVVDLPPTLRRWPQRSNERPGIDPQWMVAAAAAGGGVPSSTWRYGAPTTRRVAAQGLAGAPGDGSAFEAAHQVLVPDGMGGFIHIDHLLLTPRGVLVLDTRRVAGLIFGGDQMSDWTVMGRGRRFTFDNPQPALYDRIAAVKALVGDVPVEGRLLFSNVGKFTKGIAEVRADARRHRGGVSGRGPQPDRSPGVLRPTRRRGAGWSRSCGRARTCSRISSGGGVAQSSSRKKRTAFRVVEAARLSQATRRACARRRGAMCARYFGSLRRDIG